MELHIQLVGESPLLQNNGASINPQKAGTRARDYDPTLEAEQRLYRDPQTRQLGHPTLALYRAFIGGARPFRVRRSSAAKLLAGALQIKPVPLVPLLQPDGQPIDQYQLDVRSVVVSRQRIPRVRPRFDEWRLDLIVELDERVWEQSLVGLFKEIVGHAGRVVGLGDFRPEKLGYFGRFRLEGENNK